MRAGSRSEMLLSAGSVWYAARNISEVLLVLVFATIPNVENGLLTFFRKIDVEPGKAATTMSAGSSFAREAKHWLYFAFCT